MLWDPVSAACRSSERSLSTTLRRAGVPSVMHPPLLFGIGIGDAPLPSSRTGNGERRSDCALPAETHLHCVQWMGRQPTGASGEHSLLVLLFGVQLPLTGPPPRPTLMYSSLVALPPLLLPPSFPVFPSSSRFMTRRLVLGNVNVFRHR